MESEIRTRAVLGGTVGGLMAEAKIPWFSKKAVKFKACSGIPTIIGMICVLDFPVSNPIFARLVLMN